MNSTAAPQVRASRLAPEIVIVNAVIRTMDEARPLASAVAILGERIAAVGTTAEIRALAGPKTQGIDAGGALGLPGVNDAHVHFLTGGFLLSAVDSGSACVLE